MDKKKNVIYQSVSQTVDFTTGEISEEKITSKRQIDREPDYIKVYVSDIIKLKDIPNGMDKILMAFLSSMGYNNLIAVYSPIKRKISNDLGVSVSYINKAIEHFYKTGVFIRVDRGLYLADPELFGRGKWEDIKELRLSIAYDVKTGKKTMLSSLGSQLALEM